jgi:hypothetical protein
LTTTEPDQDHLRVEARTGDVVAVYLPDDPAAEL